MPNQEHEKERDQTHSYWYIPSAPMMKMATGEGSPLRQGAGTGLDWFSVATEACGGGTPDLGFFLEVSVFIGIFGVGLTSRRCPRRPRGRGPLPGGWVRPHPRGQPGTLLAQLFDSLAFFWSKNDLCEISGQLDSVRFSFSAIL